MKKSSLSIALSILFFITGCGRNSALDYVQPGAKIVAFGNSKELFGNRFWKKFENSDEFQNKFRKLLNDTDLTTNDLAGEFALWRIGKESLSAVFIFDKNAGTLFDKLQKNAKKITAVTGDFQGHKMLNVTSFDLFIILVDENVIQISFGEPVELFTPSSRSKLANSLDRDAIFGVAVSDGAMREFMPDYQDDLPAVSQFIIRCNDEKISIEANWDVSNMEDIYPLLKSLLPKLH